MIITVTKFPEAQKATIAANPKPTTANRSSDLSHCSNKKRTEFKNSIICTKIRNRLSFQNNRNCFSCKVEDKQVAKSAEERDPRFC